MATTDTIAVAASKAKLLLRLCCDHILQEEFRQMAAMQMDRFHLWAQNIGVFASYHSSLDYRIRAAETVKGAIQGNLEVLAVETLSALCGGRECSESEIEDLLKGSLHFIEALVQRLMSESGNSDPKKGFEALRSAEDAITTLHHLALSIRRAGNRNSLFKAVKLIETDPSFTWFKSQRHETVGVAVDSVIFDTTVSFQMYVSRLLELRWLVSPADGQHLCPRLKTYRKGLLNRCVLAISARRRQLVYFGRHQAKLAQRDEKQINPEVRYPPSGFTPSKAHKQEDHSKSPNTPLQEGNHSSIQSETVATSFHPSKFEQEAQPPPAPTSRATSVVSSQGGALRSTNEFEIPPPPEVEPGEQEQMCPYCCLVMPGRTFDKLKSRPWRHHLWNDLQPYVCLHEKCSTPAKAFASFKDWVGHMEQPHDLDLVSCPECSEDDDSLLVADDVYGGQPLNHQTHSNILHISQRCFVCLEVLDESISLWNHVAEHLRSAFLVALPWRDDFDDADLFLSDRLVGTRSSHTPILGNPHQCNLAEKDSHATRRGYLDATASREVAYCHACSNEWWRDESGMMCPRCDSEITEIVSPDNDPRLFQDGPKPDQQLSPMIARPSTSQAAQDFSLRLAQVNSEWETSFQDHADRLGSWRKETRGERIRVNWSRVLLPILFIVRLNRCSHSQSSPPEIEDLDTQDVLPPASVTPREHIPTLPASLPPTPQERLKSSVISYRSLRQHMVIPKLEPNDGFLPRSSLEELVTEASVTDALEHEQENNPMDIPNLVAFICGKDGAKKIFAILVWSEQVSLIKWFYENGVVDDMLPIYEDPSDEVYKTLGGRRSNEDAIEKLIQTSRWSPQRIDAFCSFDQWHFLAPVFRESQFKYSFSIQCRMPFLRKQTDPKDSLFSTVEQICIHKAHLEQGSNTHLSFDREGHPLVAIKSFKDLNRSNIDFQRAADTEAEVLQMIRDMRHPHLIQAIAYYTRGNKHFLVFPWAVGGNLRDFWQKEPPRRLDADFLAWAFTQLSGLASAIAELHSSERNCRHGDLKPENVLCFMNTDNADALAQPRLVIADVGLARDYNQATEFRTAAARTWSGTIMYEAPEAAIHKDKPRSRRYDVWSMGCLYLEFLVWMLYGRAQLRRFGRDVTSPDGSRKLYEVVGPGTARLKPGVQKWIEWVSGDQRFPEATAVSRLLQLIVLRLLVVEVGTVRDWTPGSARTQSRATIREADGVTPGIVRTQINTSDITDGSDMVSRATALEMYDALRGILNDATSSDTKTRWMNWEASSPGAPGEYGNTLGPSELGINGGQGVDERGHE